MKLSFGNFEITCDLDGTDPSNVQVQGFDNHRVEVRRDRGMDTHEIFIEHVDDDGIWLTVVFEIDDEGRPYPIVCFQGDGEDDTYDCTPLLPEDENENNIIQTMCQRYFT